MVDERPALLIRRVTLMSPVSLSVRRLHRKQFEIVNRHSLGLWPFIEAGRPDCSASISWTLKLGQASFQHGLDFMASAKAKAKKTQHPEIPAAAE